MERHGRETGAALILLLGIIATLAIIAATLVMAIGNQQGATALERTRKTSLYYAEGALDAAVTLAKTKTIPVTSAGGEWLPESEVQAALVAAGFPAGATLTGFAVYDNLTPVNTGIWWDSNGDGIVWVEVTVTYQGRTTRMRVLVRQSTQNVVKSFPKAIVYSDTGIWLDGTSDVFAVENDGTTPYLPANYGGAWATTVMAGGGKYSAAGAQDFKANSTANLAAPSSTVQSVNIDVNGSVTPTGRFAGTLFGGIGLLSDYFDQAAQADLGDEAQVGESHAAAPAAPTAPTAPTQPSTPSPTPTTTLTATDITNIQNSSTTTAYTTYQNTSVKTASSTNITINRATARTLYFKDLYVTGNLSVTGPVTLVVTGFLRVGGTITFNNTTATAITDQISGAVYVGSTSASSVANKVTFNVGSSFFTNGALTLSNTATSAAQLYVKGNLAVSGNSAVIVAGSAYCSGTLTVSGASSAATDQVGSLYVAGTGASSVAGTVTLNVASSIYAAGALTLSNTATTTAPLYTTGALSLTGNTALTATFVYAGGALTISGATLPMTDQINGLLYVAGTGASSVSGNVILNATSSIYAAGPLTLSNTLTQTGLLYAAGNLSLTGNTTARATALVVFGDFTISGATSAVIDQFGKIWAGGASAITTWSGTASVRTTDYTNSLAAPGPMWITILDRSGTFNDVYGDVWLTGNAGTSDVAWQVTGPTSGTACTIMCPLLATTEKTEITGKVNFGTDVKPMVYYMMCDNDTLYSNTMLLGDYDNSKPFLGTFNGLMVVMEACMEVYGTNASTPQVRGAVFNGTPYKSGTSASENDIWLRGASSVAYQQSIIDAVTNTAITTLTTTTQIVPGSWQQLPLH